MRSCHGNVFHTAEWAEFVQADQPGARPSFFSLVEDGTVIGVALGFRTASNRALAAPFTRGSWLDALPSTCDNDPETIASFLTMIEKHARGAGDVTFRIGSFASAGSDVVLEQLGFTLNRRLEFEMDLVQDENTIWKTINHRRRQRIKNAIDAGVEIRELTYEEGVFHLRRLQAASFVRIEARGGPALGERDSSHGDPIKALVKSGIGRLIGGFIDGQCVTASFFTSFNGLAYHSLSGHDDRGLEVQAPSLLLWEMCKRFKSEGAARLNFGGCSIHGLEPGHPEHGVYSYKKTYGGERIACANGEKVLRPAAQGMVTLLRRVVG